MKARGSTSKRGQIIVRAEAAAESNHAVEFQIAGHELGNTAGGCLGMCGEIVPVSYEILREIGGQNSGHFVLSFKSIDVIGTNELVWEPQKMRLTKFSNGDPTARVKIRLVANNREIGHVITSANELVDKRSHKVMKGKGTIEIKDF